MENLLTPTSTPIRHFAPLTAPVSGHSSAEPRVMVSAPAVIPAKPNPPLRLLAAFQDAYPDVSPAWVLQAPGRETWIAAALGDEAGGYRLASGDLTARAHFSRRSAMFRRSQTQRPLPAWTRYAAGVVVMLCDLDFDVPGLRAVTLSEDRSFGPRHDHAVGMAMAAVWHEICERAYTPEAILELVERVRRSYVEG